MFKNGFKKQIGNQRIRSCADGVSQNTDRDRCKSIRKNCGRLILSALQPFARIKCDKMIANCVSHYQDAHFDKQNETNDYYERQYHTSYLVAMDCAMMPIQTAYQHSCG